MYPLFETICVKNGMVQNIEWHQMRYINSYQVYYGKLPTNTIMDGIVLPDFTKSGTYKMRISYNESSKIVDFEKYTRKNIKTLKIVMDNTIEYGLKYTDRLYLDLLKRKKEDCDDILIVKNGMVTDSSICNIVFFDGHKWITPKSPLLKGTTRERLIRSGRIKQHNIRVSEISNYQYFKLINAMRDFDDIREIEVINIIK